MYDPKVIFKFVKLKMSILGTQLMYEWYTRMFAVINGHQNNTYHDDIRACAWSKDMNVSLVLKTLELVYEIT